MKFVSVSLITCFALMVFGASALCGEELSGVEALRERAEAGCEREQCNYAIACWEQGDTEEAFVWFYTAAERGIPEAQYEVGYAYVNGLGVARDEERAVQWFRKAAGQNYPEAQFELALAYVDGMGTPQNFTQAYLWLNLATSKPIGEERELCEDKPDFAANRASPEQIAEAQRLA